MGYKYFSCFFLILAALFDIIWHMHYFKAGSDGVFVADLPSPMAMSQGRVEQIGPIKIHREINPRGTRVGPANQKGAT